MAAAKILLVEDEEDLARLFELALTREGYRVRRVDGAAAGLTALRQWKPDLILLDVVLPGMSGFDFLELLRRESRVRVILISGRRRPADFILGSKLGADDYLLKPFKLEELCARVRFALSRDGAAPGAAKSSPARRRARRSSPR